MKSRKIFTKHYMNEEDAKYFTEEKCLDLAKGLVENQTRIYKSLSKDPENLREVIRSSLIDPYGEKGKATMTPRRMYTIMMTVKSIKTNIDKIRKTLSDFLRKNGRRKSISEREFRQYLNTEYPREKEKFLQDRAGIRETFEGAIKENKVTRPPSKNGEQRLDYYLINKEVVTSGC